MAALRVMNSRNVAGWARMRSPRKRGQQRARERSDCFGRAEQAGVAGRSTERPGILVVHLADEGSPPPGIELRRCDARPQCPGRVEQQRLHRDERRHFPELRRQRRRRFEPPAGARGSAGVLQDEPEQDEPEIAVDRSGPRRIFERRPADRRFELDASGVVAEERQVGRQTGAMGEEIANGDAVAVLPRHSRRRPLTGSSTASCPSSTARITRVAVAIGFVSEARSKIVSSWMCVS